MFHVFYTFRDLHGVIFVINNCRIVNENHLYNTKKALFHMLKIVYYSTRSPCHVLKILNFSRLFVNAKILHSGIHLPIFVPMLSLLPCVPHFEFHEKLTKLSFKNVCLCNPKVCIPAGYTAGCSATSASP